MLRITGGRFRGRHLQAPHGDATRPTSDMVRQALFNLLGQDLDGRHVLDVCCGSGALAMEAISRGAGSAWLVDKAKAPVACARENARLLGVEEQVTVVQGDAAARLRELEPECAQVALCDPPYALRPRDVLLAELHRVLVPEGILVLETAEDDPLNEADKMFERVQHRTYGAAALHLLRRKGVPGQQG